MMDRIAEFVATANGLLGAIIVFALGLAIIVGACFYIIDVFQTRHAVRRNFPLIGRFRYIFEALGEFFRQYFFAMDREELPFNRAQRSWVYRAAKNQDNTIAFGSSQDLAARGTVYFLNCPFPALDEDTTESAPMVIGEGYCETPYTAPSFFNISGMSYGALSRPAVQALSRGAAAAGIWLNTGEGGLSDYHLEGGCDLVFQIGTANFGVRDSDGGLSEARLREIAALPQIRMFEIKLSQGAKPGKGGILPAAKITREISRIRGIPQGVDSVSPNRRRDANSVSGLLDLVARIRDVTGKPTGFKFVLGTSDWIDELCAEIARRGAAAAPDFLTLDSGDGGSGAAPMPLMDCVGLPISESLPLVVDRLTAHGLRNRIRIIASGKLIIPSQAAWALAMGADFVNAGRGFMFALGCIQALRCNRNTCPAGVTTHNPRLQKGLVVADKSERVAHYARNLRKEVGMIAHSCGVAEPRLLRRHHGRLVLGDGRSRPLDELYPPADGGN